MIRYSRKIRLKIKKNELMSKVIYFICGFSIAVLCVMPQRQNTLLMRKRRLEFRNLLDARSGSNLDLTAYRRSRVTGV